MRPVFIKLGGSVITDKEQESTFQRNTARRLLSEIRRADAPVVLFHGAGSFGHPQAQRAGLDAASNGAIKEGISETLASVSRLHAEMLGLIHTAGLRPVSVPLHLLLHGSDGNLEGLPIDAIEQLLEDGHCPVLHGTLARDDDGAWRVVSADELMATLAAELEPRLAVFVTDVDGVLDAAGDIRSTVDGDAAIGNNGNSPDVTGAMAGKVRRGLEVAEVCPTFIINGHAKGRLEDILKGKDVMGTRLVA